MERIINIRKIAANWLFAAGLLLPASTPKAQPTTTADRPNILWLTCEDNSASWVGCYGNENATTPNIVV